MSKKKFKRVTDISAQEIEDAARILVGRLHGGAEPDAFKVAVTFLNNFKMVHTFDNDHLVRVATSEESETEDDE